MTTLLTATILLCGISAEQDASLIVRDPDGQPLAGATVQTSQWQGSGFVESKTQPKATDGEGRTVLSGLDPRGGDIRIVVHHSDYTLGREYEGRWKASHDIRMEADLAQRRVFQYCPPTIRRVPIWNPYCQRFVFIDSCSECIPCIPTMPRPAQQAPSFPTRALHPSPYDIYVIPR